MNCTCVCSQQLFFGSRLTRRVPCRQWEESTRSVSSAGRMEEEKRHVHGETCRFTSWFLCSATVRAQRVAACWWSRWSGRSLFIWATIYTADTEDMSRIYEIIQQEELLQSLNLYFVCVHVNIHTHIRTYKHTHTHVSIYFPCCHSWI